MKITTTASGKTQVKLSKSEWESIGKKAGWMKMANNADAFADGYEMAQISVEEAIKQNLQEVLNLMRVNPQEFVSKNTYILSQAETWGESQDILYREFMNGLYQGLVIQLSEHDLSKLNNDMR